MTFWMGVVEEVGSLLLIVAIAAWVFRGSAERLFPGDPWWAIGLKLLAILGMLLAISVLGPLWGGPP